ncbi:MAG: cyclic nucleotide-gated ion channel [Arenicellales bacterium]|nr:cyclic nucleotide-gated ion channel [Arenicellales bacterium]
MRTQIYQILYSDSRPLTHNVVKALILLSVAAVVAIAMIKTLPRFDLVADAIMNTVRMAAMAVLTIELVARFWVAPEGAAHAFENAIPDAAQKDEVSGSRLAYLRSSLGLVDLLVVLPAWANLLYPISPHWFELTAALSLFKLSRYVPGLSLVTAVVARQARSIYAALVVLGILLVCSATVIYMVEYETQPAYFTSIPHSLWWAISTMATVGSGDMAPITPIGRIVGGIAMVFGIAMFAVPAGILASGFAEELRKRDFVVNWQSVARVPLFARLDANAIASVAQLLKPRSVSANQVIVRRGDIADSMYFIMEGEVEVDITPNPVRLKQGDFFGEIALVENIPRTATILSLTNCRLLVLETVDFERLTTQIPDLKDQIKRISDKRLPGQ